MGRGGASAFGLSGRTNDERSGRPTACGARISGPGPSSRPPTFGRIGPSSTPSTIGAAGRWEVFGRDVRLTNLEDSSSPGRGKAGHQTGPRAVCGADRPDPRPLPDPASAEHAPVPERCWYQGFWHKELPSHAPSWLTRWDNPNADRARRDVPRRRRPAALVWVANYGALGGTGPHGSRTNRPTRAGRPRPRRRTTWPELRPSRGCTGRPSSTWASTRGPSDSRRGIQIWVPIRGRPSFDGPASGSNGCRGRWSSSPSGRWSGRSARRRAQPGWTHPERRQQDPGGAHSPRAAAGAPVSASSGTSSTTQARPAPLRPGPSCGATSAATCSPRSHDPPAPPPLH
jgi:bifunctional non-homologous end joining protein LigD